MIKAYLFIKSKRMKKKLAIYLRLIRIVFDLTSVIYMLLLVTYVVYASLQSANLAGSLTYGLSIWQSIFQLNWLILCNLILLPNYVLQQSFRRPGICFSTAENFLISLPYRREAIWRLSFIESLMKYALAFGLVYLLLYLTNSISFLQALGFFFLTMLLLASMTLVQWRVFQEAMMIRITIVTLSGLLAVIYFLSQQTIALLIYITYLLILFIYAFRNVFNAVDWPRVIARSDFERWNMKLLSLATKIKFQEDKQPSMWYRMKEWKAPFPYQVTAVYHRLWYIYFEKQIGLLLKVNGTMFLWLTIVPMIHVYYFLISLVLALHIQSSFLVSLYRESLETGSLQMLPWKLKDLSNTFVLWAALISLFLFIPVSYYSLFYFPKFFIWYLICSIGFFYLILSSKLWKTNKRLTKQAQSLDQYEWLLPLGLILFILSPLHPIYGIALSLLWIYLLLYVKRNPLQADG